MSYSVDWATFGNQSSYLDFGNIRVAFGYNTQNYISGTEVQSSAISYGINFATVITVVAVPTGWNPISEFMTNVISSTSFKIVLKQNYGQALNITVHWVAIGTIA